MQVRFVKIKFDDFYQQFWNTQYPIEIYKDLAILKSQSIYMSGNFIPLLFLNFLNPSTTDIKDLYSEYGIDKDTENLILSLAEGGTSNYLLLKNLIETLK